MTREEQLAYAAGLIDGEGCIGLYNTRPSKDTRAAFYQLTVRVAMKTPRPIEFLYRLFGSGRTIAASKGPGKPGPYFCWQARNKQAEVVLIAILPYLVEKGEQAKVALEFGQFRRAQRKSWSRSRQYPVEMLVEREKYVAQLKALKRVPQLPVWAG